VWHVGPLAKKEHLPVHQCLAATEQPFRRARHGDRFVPPVSFRRLGVLMITIADENDLTRTLKLQGKLLGPWISELESACGPAQFSPDRVRLDLLGLTFVDAEGARFLERLIRGGARVIACSGFAAEMLHIEGS
jgi:hypothetical protein